MDIRRPIELFRVFLRCLPGTDNLNSGAVKEWCWKTSKTSKTTKIFIIPGCAKEWITTKLSLIYSGNVMNSFENNANKEAPPEINFWMEMKRASCPRLNFVCKCWVGGHRNEESTFIEEGKQIIIIIIIILQLLLYSTEGRSRWRSLGESQSGCLPFCHRWVLRETLPFFAASWMRQRQPVVEVDWRCAATMTMK